MLAHIDGYTALKFVHVLAAIVWVGGAVGANVIGTRVMKTNDDARLAGFLDDTEWMGTHIYLPASLIVLIFGILAALRGHYSFTQEWLIIGIVGIVATAATGSAFLGPELKRIAAIVKAKGINDAEVKRRTSRLVLVARVDLAVMLIVIAAMVLKPGL